MFNEKIDCVFPDRDLIIPHDHAMLLLDRQPRFAKLVHQGVLIDFLKEAGPQRVKHRLGAAYDWPGQPSGHVRAAFYLRVLRVLRFHYLCMITAKPFRFVNAGKSARSAPRPRSHWGGPPLTSPSFPHPQTEAPQ